MVGQGGAGPLGLILLLLIDGSGNILWLMGLANTALIDYCGDCVHVRMLEPPVVITQNYRQ
jgi:hypothetical protein